MKIVRFGEKGKEKPGVWKDGKIADLTHIFPEIPDICERFFREGWLEKISHFSFLTSHFSISDSTVRLGSPVHRPSKIICLGKNYAEHAKEGGFEYPEKPLLFCKTPNALNGPFDPIILPKSSTKTDWEVELAVIIGKEGKGIRKEDTADYIAGYSVMNDVSGREAQFGDGQWFRGKSFDTFAPLGPFLVTKDEIADAQNLRLTALVDGIVMQDGNTKDMIFDIPFLIEYISQDITLFPGDIISTGTPAGVGIFRNPPIVLNIGNVVECSVEKIGVIVNQCSK